MISLYLGLIRTRDAAVVWESGEIATTGSVQMPQPTIEKAVVHAVDDDSLRRAVDSLGRSVGFETRTGGSAQQFLDAKREDIAGCLVLDVRLPGMRGLDFQSQLAALGIRLLVILVAGHGDEGRQTPRRLRAGLYQGVILAIARRIGRKHRCVHPQARADASDHNTVDIVGLPSSRHKVLVDATHQAFTACLAFTIPT